MDDLLALNIGGKADAGAPMQLLHPEHRTPLIAASGKPLTITLRGRDSDAFVSAEREARTRAVENMTEQVKWSAAEQDLLSAQTLARCTVGWHGVPQDFIDNSGSAEPAECTYENAVKLYENRGVKWVREQADKFVSNRANFLRA